MALIEQEIGVRSTYFFWLSSDHYNPLELKNVYIMKKIMQLGHEIGLHYDITQYERYGFDIRQTLLKEIKLLENILDTKINSISCHDSRDPFSAAKIDGYIDADDPLSRDLYVHESRKIWTIKSLSELLEENPYRVHLLIHPCNWGEDSDSLNKMDKFVQILLLFLFKLRTLVIRLIHSRERCER